MPEKLPQCMPLAAMKMTGLLIQAQVDATPLRGWLANVEQIEANTLVKARLWPWLEPFVALYSLSFLVLRALKGPSRADFKWCERAGP